MAIWTTAAGECLSRCSPTYPFGWIAHDLLCLADPRLAFTHMSWLRYRCFVRCAYRAQRLAGNTVEHEGGGNVARVGRRVGMVMKAIDASGAVER